MTSEQATAGAAVVGVLIALITAIVAIASLSATRADSRDRSRPMIVPEIRKEPLAKGCINLVIRNLGASPARDVRVSFDEHKEHPDDLPITNHWKWILGRYSQPIRVWAPGWELSNVVKAGPDEKLEAFTIRVTYNSAGDSPGRGRQRYADKFLLDARWILNNTEAGSSDSTSSGEKWWRDWGKRGIRALEVIARSLYRGQ